VDEAEARANSYGTALLRQIADGDRLVRWSLRTDDIERVAAARGLVPEPRSRRRPDGTLLTWREAMLRIAGAFVSLAALGLGYFWIWIDRDRLAWHDRWTQTRVAVLPKRRK
jgi:hypothetical protein